MNGDERTNPKPWKLTPPAVAIQLQHGIPGDDFAIRLWIAYLHEIGREDLAKAAEEAKAFVVRRRWPKPDTPLPRIPRDFTPRMTGER